MTSDEFNAQYKLLKPITAKGGRSYTAEHRSTGRAVLVHMIDETQVGGAAGLQNLLEQLSPRDRSRILGTMTVDQSLVVVTQFLAGFEGFEDWLRARTSGPVQPPAPLPGPPPDSSHGEFTRLFRAAEDTEEAGQQSGPAFLDSPSFPAKPGGSEYTDLFRAPAGPPTQPPAPDHPAIPPIRMVGLRVPLPSEPVPPQGEPPPRLTPNFQSGPEAVPDSDPGANWLRQRDPVIHTGEEPPPPVPPPSWDGPSEFTRLLGTASPLTGELAEMAAQPLAEAEPPQPKRSYLPLFLVLNVIFILATGLVVYFALRQC